MSINHAANFTNTLNTPFENDVDILVMVSEYKKTYLVRNHQDAAIARFILTSEKKKGDKEI